MLPDVGLSPGRPGYRRLQAALLAAGVATFAQLYATQPVLPEVARAFAVDEARAALSVSAATLGLAVAVVPWSFLADRWGRRRAILLSLAVATAAALAFPLVPDYPGLLLARLVQGAALGGVPATAVAYVSEEVAPRFVAVAAATYLAGTSVGGLSGRVVCGLVAEMGGWRAGCLAVGAVGVVTLLLFALLAPTAPGPATPDAAGPGQVPRRTPAQVTVTMLAAARAPGVWRVCAVAFLLMGGFVAVYNTLAFRLSGPPYLLTPALLGLLFLSYLAGTVSARVAGRASLRWPRRTILLAGTAVMAAGLAGTAAAPLWLIVAALLVLTFGFFAAHSIAAGWAPVLAPGTPAQAASLYTLGYYAGSSVLGWAAGHIWAAWGWTGVVAAVLALVAVAAVLIAGLPGRGAS